MGYKFKGFAINLNTLKNAFGSKDKDLIQNIMNEGAILQQMEHSRDLIEDDVKKGGLTLEKALESLIMGSKLEKKSASAYICALELILMHIGAENEGEYDIIIKFNDIFKEKQITDDIDIIKLFERGSPIKIPPIAKGNLPSIGYWTEPEVQKAWEALKEIDLSEIDEEEINEAFREFKDWLESAVKEKSGLVGIYY